MPTTSINIEPSDGSGRDGLPGRDVGKEETTRPISSGGTPGASARRYGNNIELPSCSNRLPVSESTHDAVLWPAYFGLGPSKREHHHLLLIKPPAQVAAFHPDQQSGKDAQGE
jgi:hypothetical protein